MTAKKLENMLRPGVGGSLEKIIQIAQDMDTLTDALKGGLPTELAEHVIAANIKADKELVVICSSSAWASRLRFESEVLLASAASAGFKASSCKVVVTRNP
jgi:hypothetical protein